MEKKLLLSTVVWWVLLVSFGLIGAGYLALLWIATTFPRFLLCEGKTPSHEGTEAPSFFLLLVAVMETITAALLVGLIAGATSLKLLTSEPQLIAELGGSMVMFISTFFYLYATISTVRVSVCLVQASHGFRLFSLFLVTCLFFALVRLWGYMDLAHLKENIEMIGLGILAAWWLYEKLSHRDH